MRRRWAILFGLAATAVLAAAAVLAFGYAQARADPVVRRATVVLPGWPAGARPVRLVLMSDIHIGSAAMDSARLSRIVDGVNALDPDVVLIAGDFVYGHAKGSARRIAPPLVAPLARLRPRLRTIAVLGNHDWWTGADAVRAALARAGVTVLDNRAVRVGPLAIGGIGDRMTRHDRPGATIAAMRRLGGALVVVTHGPDVVPLLPRGVPLVLAGHTHCGQGVIFGRALAREPYLRRYRCGIVRDRGRATIVTAGLGTSVVPLRIGSPPDLWLLTLRGTATADGARR